MKTTITLSLESKNQLDQIKSKFGFKTMGDTVHKCSDFILKNKIDLTSNYEGERNNIAFNLERKMALSLQELEKKLTKDNSSLRKWVGGVEKDYFVPLLKKITAFEDKVNLSVPYNKSDKSEYSQIENPINPLRNIEHNVVQTEDTFIKINQLKQELDTSNKAYDEIEVILNKYKKALFELMGTTKIETSGMMGKEKVVINISVEEYKKIKQQF